jgi:hypothetical protein
MSDVPISLGIYEATRPDPDQAVRLRMEVAFWRGWTEGWMQSYAFNPIDWMYDRMGPMPKYDHGDPQAIRSVPR